MQAYFEDVFAYHRWASRAVLRAMTEATALPPLAITLFSHILNAHTIWLDRIAGQPLSYAVWQEHTLATVDRLVEESYLRTLSLLQSREYGSHCEGTIHYQNTQGVSFENTVREILTHIANHTTHHRAQIVRELREHDITPPATDYILYKRLPTTD